MQIAFDLSPEREPETPPVDPHGLRAVEEKVIPLLLDVLQVAVPLRIWELRQMSEYARSGLVTGEQAWCGHTLPGEAGGGRCCRSVSEIIAAHADDLLFGGKRCAVTFNALAKALALGAFQPGGMGIFGMHWCVGSGHTGGVPSITPCDEECARERGDAA